MSGGGPAAAPALGGRYRLEQRLAAGGMGTVWAATDELLNRRVAVKVLNEGLADEPRFIERFRREAKAAAGLQHQNVAGVFDYGEEDGRPFIVMELVEGETLAQRLAREGRLPADEVARVGADAAAALALAHEAGIVHRDVKPANVMLTPRGEVKVMDFGIAAEALAGGTGLTGTGMVMGTARYLSPEQAVGRPATPASDVYALGAVMYEMLAGHPPFERPTPMGTAMAHVKDPVPPLTAERPDVPARLAAVVERCLAKEPGERPASAGELAAELRGEAPAAPDEATAVLPAAGATEVLPAVEAAGAESGRARGADPAGAGLAGGAAAAAAVQAQDAEPTELVAPVRRAPTRGAPSTRRRRAFLLAALAALVILIVVLAVTLSGDGAPGVPKFIGLRGGEAARLAEDAGLDPEFRARPSDEEKGVVIAQHPAPGDPVAPGDTVILIVSGGAAAEPGATSPPPSDEGENEGEGGGDGRGKGKDKGGKGKGHGKKG